MDYQNYRPDWNKPSIFTAQQYGTKVSVEVERSDMDLDEVMDAFQTLIIGLGYHQDAFKKWVIERAEEYNETDAEELKEKLEAYTLEDFKREEAEFNLRHQYEDREELENDFFGSYDDEAEKRMDIIGQNGNDGLHYRATDEDEAEFDDYGKRIEKAAVSFEWGDEPEEDYDGQFDDWKNETPEDDDLFEGDEWKSNQKLAEANERYKSEVKKMKSKKRNNKD